MKRLLIVITAIILAGVAAMADTSALQKAKKTKNDEFYTQYADIQTEVNAYLEYNPDTFRGKTVLLPCDDPEESNFTRFFAENFTSLGLKKLISTSYAPEAKKAKYGLDLFDWAAGHNLDPKHGRMMILDHDVNGDGKINFEDLEWWYLNASMYLRKWRQTMSRRGPKVETRPRRTARCCADITTVSREMLEVHNSSGEAG